MDSSRVHYVVPCEGLLGFHIWLPISLRFHSWREKWRLSQRGLPEAKRLSQSEGLPEKRYRAQLRYPSDSLQTSV
jgi:hypothetical protein